MGVSVSFWLQLDGVWGKGHGQDTIPHTPLCPSHSDPRCTVHPRLPEWRRDKTAESNLAQTTKAIKVAALQTVSDANVPQLSICLCLSLGAFVCVCVCEGIGVGESLCR